MIINNKNVPGSSLSINKIIWVHKTKDDVILQTVQEEVKKTIDIWCDDQKTTQNLQDIFVFDKQSKGFKLNLTRSSL